MNAKIAKIEKASCRSAAGVVASRDEFEGW